MKRIYEPLSKHTWLKIGGTAEIAIPNSEQELISVIDECYKNGRSFRILGNGSNVLASDNEFDELIIKTTKCCDYIEFDSNLVTVGSSVQMPYLANKIIEQGLGGIEYLVSVPGTIGGGIVMNAGQGKGGDTISQHVEKVRYYDGRSIQEESAADLKFENRYSIFQEHTDWIILSATFKFSNQPPEIGQKKIKQRAKKIDDRERALPNAGSVFKSGNLLPNLGFRVGGAKYCHGNRICNVDNASFDDAMSLIKYTRLFHRVIPFINVPEVEIRVWE